MKHVVVDVETDGLLDVLTRVHSLVLRDMDSDSVFSCTNDAPGYHSIEEGLSLLSEAEVAYAHNGISFDFPAIRKVYPGFTPKGRLRDTYVIASMRWAHIKESDFARARRGRLPKQLIGWHTLEAWGYRLGVMKTGTDIKDWSKWTREMQDRCESDTAVTKALVERIRAAGVSPDSLETEHELAEYLTQQERNGWPFDVEKAVTLQAKLAAKRQTLENNLRTLFDPWVAPNGVVTPKRDNKKKGVKTGCPYTKLKIIEFNPSSRDHIANRLTKLYGWEPGAFTENGKPIIDENTLKGLDYPPVEQLREYLLVDKRLGQLAEGKQAWLKNLQYDSPEGGRLTGLAHIHGRVIQSGAVTHRAAHSRPNVAQTPKNKSPYGEECRELYHAPAGWAQLGADASGLELRCLAHFLARYDGGAYTKVLLEGDVHSITQQALASWVDEGDKGRDTSKTWMYAFLYGAGDEKLGRILVLGASEALLPKMRQHAKSKETFARLGAASRDLFLASLPALKYLQADLEATVARNKGYILGLDGRRVYVRHKHAMLNTLLQSAGALICKRWIVEYNRRLCREFSTPPGGGWRHPWAATGWIHDETQMAVRPDVKTRVGTILEESIRAMTEHFNFRCPLDGKAKYGMSWKETH